MLFEREVLVRYSEFLEQQGLVIGDGAKANDELAVPRKAPGEDKRTHEQLVEDFLGSQQEPWDEGVMPPGWYHDETTREMSVKLECTRLRDKLRAEEAERVAAQRMMADRAHYVPREDFDAATQRFADLDKAYAQCRADHLREEQRAEHLDHALTILKTHYNKDTKRLREHLAKAYEILAGAYPPVPDADLGRVLYEAMSRGGPRVMNSSGYEALDEEGKEGWLAAAEELRARWSTVERAPMAYERLAQEWGAAQRELLKIETDIQTYAPGLERRIGPDEWMDTSDAVRALFAMVRDGVQANVSILRAWWPILNAAANVAGYEVQPPEVRRIDEWSGLEPTHDREEDVWARLTEELAPDPQAASEGCAGPTCDVHGQEVFAESSDVQAAADKLAHCQHELSRLQIGLEREGITAQSGEGWVDVALRAVQGWGNAHLGLATTGTLIAELEARGRRNGWPGWAQQQVEALRGGLDEDEMTYKTADGRSAS